ncbi:tetratricopeptide repeat protein [Myceligenerans indicum]|uniref:Tetratricopeptide repeat protein n=1 Tax=Myceligenerans indicum TaxID=2593663 RepID=A0ABS1LJ23_9MICO|nr:tetratricopeptide repeat protein [Myceligenerans indicum]MBL0886207.1 tetratricopeptide repeat protein [Myceligenerans indicum]
MASEVMLRFGAAEDAFAWLSGAPLPRSLRLTLATLAVELNRLDVAMEALADQDGAMIESFRGFLLVAEGRYQKAIPHLRAALRDSPEDVAAAMNLSAALWAIGSRRKAVSAALRASRAAPGRKDASLHYLDLLLEVGDVRRLTEEISMLNARGIIPDAHFLVVQARAQIAKDEVVRALPLLDSAIAAAISEGNDPLRVEIQANLAVLKYRLGRWSYTRAIDALSALLRDYPENDAVVVSFARIADRTTEASALRAAIDNMNPRMDPARVAFVRHQLAWLEGDNKAAASAATEWFELDAKDPLAATSALISLGIGMERWQEAEKIAEYALEEFPNDSSVVNNASYILAMAGKPRRAIQALEPWAADDYVLEATLGLAHLANGDTDGGMRLYRQAAGEAERVSSERLSLMVAYQALVVRQLGIDKQEPPGKLAALALAFVPLPTDWERRPEFVRLRNLARKHGYEWPLAL